MLKTPRRPNSTFSEVKFFFLTEKYLSAAEVKEAKVCLCGTQTRKITHILPVLQESIF